ncbi:MAG: hypothetical protein U5K30_09535 [Acidimicrobiales bacterium]|nr:hypothetical protein [Acidimicrobiales bacterium]
MLLMPFDLRVEPIARFMNCELADHPVYDGAEVQWFDDDVHGTGMLAFLSRREEGTADFYVQPGLRLDRSMFTVGSGIGSWQEHDFGDCRLEVDDDGVLVDVSFIDTGGRMVEIAVDDRDGRVRDRGSVLAPVSDGIERPESMLVVYMTEFDLVRLTGEPPVVRIDGTEVTTGRLPGQALHRRALVKYASGLVVARLDPHHDGAVTVVDPTAPGKVRLVAGGHAIEGMVAETAGVEARLWLSPPLPALTALLDGGQHVGEWVLDVAGDRITGGTVTARRQGDHVAVTKEVTRRWTPGRLPTLMQAVTRFVPVFRRWPRTYRWHADVRLGEPATMTSGWERVGRRRDSYRRATGS